MITRAGREVDWLYPLAFQHLMQYMDEALGRSAERLESTGQISGDDILELESWTEPPIMSRLDFGGLRHSESFSRWWGLLSSDL